MRYLWLVPSLALLGCSADQPATLAVAQAAPSSTLELSMEPLIVGARVAITVTGAAPGERVYVMRSTAGEGAGDCPTFLGGNCMDMIGPYTLTLQGRANNLGIVSWTIPSFPDIPPTDVWFQAVTLDGANSNESEVWFGPVLAACAADTYEPNDTLLTSSSVTAGSYTGLNACLSDDDFYIVQDVPPGSYIAATAVFDHDGEGDLDLYLWDGVDSIIGSSTSATSDEDAVWLNTRGVPTSVAVRAIVYRDDVGIPGIPYELDIEVATPAVCVDDALEDNDTQGAATVAPLGSVWSAVACDGPTGPDADWYRIDIADGEVASITVQPQARGERLLGTLYSDAGVELDVDQFGEIDLSGVGDGQPLWLSIEFAEDDARGGGVSYDAFISVAQPAPCVVDASEPNNDSTEATAVTAGTVTGTGCPSDSDWYSITLQTDELLLATLTHDPMDGDQDVDITLWDSNLSVVDSEDFNFTSPEVVRGAVSSPETFFIEVSTAQDDIDGGGVDYTLDLQITQITPCLPDSFEPNDTLFASATITPGSYADLSACEEGAPGYDYYAVDLLAGQQLVGQITFDNDEGDIDLDLLGPVGNMLLSSSTINDVETVTYTAAVDETVYLRVDLFRDNGDFMPGNTYDLEVTVN